MDIKEIDNTLDELDEEIKEGEERENFQWILKKYKGPDEVIDSHKFKEQSSKDTSLYKVGSGLTELDRIIEGFRPGTVVIVSGPTKQGKTTLCQTFTSNFTKQGYPCLWFSFDTPPIEVIERFGDDNLPIFYLPKKNAPEKKMTWIEQKIIESLAKYNTRMVFIDHLEFLSRMHQGASGNYSDELTYIVRELKEISIRWNVTIFLNHHIKRIPDDETPNWNHLKNSSGPAQEADLTLMLWREKQKASGGVTYTDNTFISVELHRRTGRTGIIKVQFKDNILYDSKPEYKGTEF